MGWSDALKGVVAAAVPFVGPTALAMGDSIINNYSNKKAASRQYGYEKSLMDYQNEWNLQQWNRENEYNSPKNIMARYTEAGLNPNLIYGNSYASPAHLESATGHAPQVKPAQSDITGAVLAKYNIELQNELLAAQINQVKASTKTTTIKNQITEKKEQFSNKYGVDYDSTAGRIVRAGVSIGNALSENLPSESMDDRESRNAVELYRSGKLNLEYDPVIDRFYYIGNNKKKILTFGKNIY